MIIKNLKFKIKNFIVHPLFSGSILMVGGSMVVNAINYVYHVVMGRILGPVNYGILASIFSILYITTIVPVSSSFAIVKFISDAKGEKERQVVYIHIKKLVWKIALSSMFLIVVFSGIIADFLHISDIVSVVLVGPILFLSLIILVDQAAMQGILRFTGVVLPNFSSAITKLILGLAFVFLGFSVTGAIWGIFLGLILTYWATLKIKGNLFSKEVGSKFDISHFLKYAFPVLIQALAFTSIFTIDIILAKHFLPSFEAGLYAALSTLGKIIYFATQPIVATMFPIVSGRRARGERYREVFFAAFFVTTLVSLGIVGFYYFFPNIAIGLLYGREYLSASRDLFWMGIFIGVYSLAYLIVNFFLSLDRTKIVLAPALAALIQILGITIWHESILQIIQVSFFATLALFSLLVVYLGLQWARRDYSLS